MEPKNFLDESSYRALPENAFSRRAQMPILTSRLRYLLKEYSPDSSKAWAMFHHTGHFLIYSNILKCCVFDATSLLVRKLELLDSLDDPVHAVISEYRVDTEALQLLKVEDSDDGFRTLFRLLKEEL